MNNTLYTNKELKSIILPAFAMNGTDHVMVESPTAFNQSLVEFCEDEPIEIGDVFGDDLIEINFSQTLLACGDIDCCGMTSYHYTMVIDKHTIDILLGNIKIEDVC